MRVLSQLAGTMQSREATPDDHHLRHVARLFLHGFSHLVISARFSFDVHAGLISLTVVRVNLFSRVLAAGLPGADKPVALVRIPHSLRLQNNFCIRLGVSPMAAMSWLDLTLMLR